MDSAFPRDEDRLAPDRHLAASRASDSGQLLLVSFASLISFVLLTTWVVFIPRGHWELETLQALAARPDLSGVVTSAINALGNLPIWAALVAVMTVAVAALRGLAMAVLVALSFASDFAAFAVKLIVQRQRPETAAVEHFFGPDNFAYPSGHTVRAAALVAVALWVLLPPSYRVVGAVGGGLLAGAVMGFSRVSLGVHWPTDTIGGTLLGLAWFAITAFAYTRQTWYRTNGSDRA